MIERYDLIVIGAGPAGLSAAIEAAKNGDLNHVPERFEKTYLHWLEEIRTQGEDKRIQHRLRTS